MFEISKNYVITMTRGDTAIFDVGLDNYELQEGDIIEFSVKKDINDEEYVIHKVSDNGEIILYPEDTIALKGKHCYDIQLTTTMGVVSTLVKSTIIFEMGVTE